MQLINDIYRLVENFLPTKIIKPSNAFSLRELCAKEEILKAMQNLEFEEIQILGEFRKKNHTVYLGSCFISDGFLVEDDFELLIEIRSSSEKFSINELSTKKYELNLATKEVLIELIQN